MAEVILSKRLRALAEMVTPGRRVVDVGCDHGFVSIYLVQKGISPRVLAMDVRKGPLSRAQEHIAEYGLDDYIETRLSDGLLEYRVGEADALVCAGMGGRLMQKILTDSREKVLGLKELILQPQSELAAFRRYLRSEGYRLVDESILYEEGKYYFLMKVCVESVDTSKETQEQPDTVHSMKRGDASKNAPNEKQQTKERLYDKYGEFLLERKELVLKQYLEDTLKNMQQIEESLVNNANDRARARLMEVRLEIADLQEALSLF